MESIGEIVVIYAFMLAIVRFRDDYCGRWAAMHQGHPGRQRHQTKLARCIVREEGEIQHRCGKAYSRRPEAARGKEEVRRDERMGVGPTSELKSAGVRGGRWGTEHQQIS